MRTRSHSRVTFRFAFFKHSNVCTVRMKRREDQAGTTTAASAWTAVGKCGGGKETDSRYFSEVESKELGGHM